MQLEGGRGGRGAVEPEGEAASEPSLVPREALRRSFPGALTSNARASLQEALCGAGLLFPDHNLPVKAEEDKRRAVPTRPTPKGPTGPGASPAFNLAGPGPGPGLDLYLVWTWTWTWSGHLLTSGLGHPPWRPDGLS